MIKSTYIKHNKCFFSYSAKFCYSDSHRGSKVKNYRVVRIIRLLLYLGCTINHRNIPFGYFLHQAPPLCFLSLQSWRSWWSRRKWVRRYHNSWCTETLGGLFEHVPGICLFPWWSLFLVKIQIPSLGTTLLMCWIIRISKLLDIRIEEFYCTYIFFSLCLMIVCE